MASASSRWLGWSAKSGKFSGPYKPASAAGPDTRSATRRPASGSRLSVPESKDCPVSTKKIRPPRAVEEVVLDDASVLLQQRFDDLLAASTDIEELPVAAALQGCMALRIITP